MNIPDCCKTFKKEIVESNDIVSEFLDEFIEITHVKHHKITKDELFNFFRMKYPRIKDVKGNQLLNDFKDIGLVYNCSMKLNRKKGCYRY